MPATRCRAAWRVPVSQPWLESLSSALASWWSSIFAPPIARFARLRLAPLAIGDDAHHFVNNVRSNPNFSTYAKGQTSISSDTPLWIPQAAVTFGMLLLALQFLARVIQALLGLPLEDPRMKAGALVE